MKEFVKRECVFIPNPYRNQRWHPKYKDYKTYLLPRRDLVNSYRRFETQYFEEQYSGSTSHFDQKSDLAIKRLFEETLDHLIPEQKRLLEASRGRMTNVRGYNYIALKSRLSRAANQEAKAFADEEKAYKKAKSRNKVYNLVNHMMRKTKNYVQIETDPLKIGYDQFTLLTTPQFQDVKQSSPILDSNPFGYEGYTLHDVETKQLVTTMDRNPELVNMALRGVSERISYSTKALVDNIPTNQLIKAYTGEEYSQILSNGNSQPIGEHALVVDTTVPGPKIYETPYYKHLQLYPPSRKESKPLLTAVIADPSNPLENKIAEFCERELTLFIDEGDQSDPYREPKFDFLEEVTIMPDFTSESFAINKEDLLYHESDPHI